MTANANLSGLSMTDTTTRPLKNKADVGQGGQFVSFLIGERAYCVDIMSVREIKAWSTTTVLPNAPDYVRGVLNLRGTIVPIHDLRIRFGEGITKAGSTHVIVIVAVADRIAGLLVDAVSDILTVNQEEVKPIPVGSSTSKANYLSGLISISGELTAILDLERLFEDSDASADTQH